MKTIINWLLYFPAHMAGLMVGGVCCLVVFLLTLTILFFLTKLFLVFILLKFILSLVDALCHLLEN